MKYELQWTVRFFMSKAQHWHALELASDTDGHQAYTAKKVGMWNGLGRSAEATALRANPTHTPIWTAA